MLRLIACNNNGTIQHVFSSSYSSSILCRMPPTTMTIRSRRTTTPTPSCTFIASRTMANAMKQQQNDAITSKYKIIRKHSPETKEQLTGQPQPPMQTFEQQQLEEMAKEQQLEKGGATKEAKRLGKRYMLAGNIFKALLVRLAFRKFFPKEQRILMSGSAAKLYIGCSNDFHYMALREEFGLKDDYLSWFRLTVLHMWLVLVRLQHSLECYSYILLRYKLFTILMKDFVERYEIIYKDNALARIKKRKHVHQVYYSILMQTMFEMDEGFLLDDRRLAGALWRSLFIFDEELDAIHLNRAVRYVRETMHFLEHLDTEALLSGGIERWGPAERIAERIRGGRNKD